VIGFRVPPSASRGRLGVILARFVSVAATTLAVEV